MADGLNKCMLLGNLGADPELRVTSGGQSVLTLRLACSESYLDKNRVRQERVEWVQCVVWGRRAEALAKFLKKGSKIFVEGSLQTQSWEDREGVKRYRTQVVAHNVILGGGSKARSVPEDERRERPNRRSGGQPQREEEKGSYDNGGFDGSDYGAGGVDDGIPF
jgi:single-strand DNA-binding protein